MNALAFDHVSHAFARQKVLQDVSFSLSGGEMICLLGPSGCGKTTLLRLAAGLEEIQHGRIRLDRHLVADRTTGLNLPPEKRHVGLCFQDFALFPHLNVMDNILFGVRRNRSKRRQWALAMLEMLGLEDRVSAWTHGLSGGEQQRIALLRALAPEPGVILLDEPFSSLDTSLRARLREETLNIIRDAGSATMMVTHDAEEAMFMADRILVMNEGRIVQAGTPARTYTRPVSPFVAALFGPVNCFEGVIRHGKADTPIGSFPAKGMAEGKPVQVLIRPEGLEPVQTDGSGAVTCSTTVVSAHFLGGTSHLHLRLKNDGQRRPVDCQARVPGTFLPETGSKIALGVNLSHVHVFPSECGKKQNQ